MKGKKPPVGCTIAVSSGLILTDEMSDFVMSAVP